MKRKTRVKRWKRMDGRGLPPDEGMLQIVSIFDFTIFFWRLTCAAPPIDLILVKS